MIIHDYECPVCGNVQEEYLESDDIPEVVKCNICNGMAYKIVSLRETSPVDCTWITSVVEVVDKQSNAPHCKEFIRHPTRANMNNWMKGENLRTFEDGESPMPDKIRTPEYRRKVKDKMLTKYRERNAVEF